MRSIASPASVAGIADSRAPLTTGGAGVISGCGATLSSLAGNGTTTGSTSLETPNAVEQQRVFVERHLITRTVD